MNAEPHKHTATLHEPYSFDTPFTAKWSVRYGDTTVIVKTTVQRGRVFHREVLVPASLSHPPTPEDVEEALRAAIAKHDEGSLAAGRAKADREESLARLAATVAEHKPFGEVVEQTEEEKAIGGFIEGPPPPYILDGYYPEPIIALPQKASR